eukprot:255871-Amphidinium_carterae.1
METLQAFVVRAQQYPLFVSELKALHVLQAEEGLETTPDLAFFFLSKEQAESRGVGALWEFAASTSGIPSQLVKTALRDASVNRPPPLLAPPRTHHKVYRPRKQAVLGKKRETQQQLVLAARLVHISLSWSPTCGLGKGIPTAQHWSLLQHDSVLVKRIAKFEVATLRAVLRTWSRW